MTISHKPVDSALNPAWRNAAVHLISSVEWNDMLPSSEARHAIARVTNSTRYAMRQLAPESGVHYNEVWQTRLFTYCYSVEECDTGCDPKANPWEPDWQWAFWDPKYPRVLSIKKKYGPENLLWCRHCVGSESMVQQKDGSLCSAV